MSCLCWVFRLWEAGWKQRYYKNKFDVDAADEKFRRKVVQSYVEGLCWVLRYYYQVQGKIALYEFFIVLSTIIVCIIEYILK